MPELALLVSLFRWIDARRLWGRYLILLGSTVCGCGRCYYRQATDTVSMTIREAFRSAEGYYGYVFHELTHSTGHEKRLDRDLKGGFGSERYSREELIAELGGAFLCAHCHIDALH